MPLQRGIKRAIDLLVAGFFLIPVLAALVPAAIVVQRYYRGLPIFFRQERVGRNQEIFQLLKLRTYPAHQRSGPAPTDLPAAIMFIRRHGIDELPQLFQVISGRLSLIGGTRPLLEEEFPLRYGAKGPQVARSKPGVLTHFGLWLHDHPEMKPAPYEYIPFAADLGEQYSQSSRLLVLDAQIAWIWVRSVLRIAKIGPPIAWPVKHEVTVQEASMQHDLLPEGGTP